MYVCYISECDTCDAESPPPPSHTYSQMHTHHASEWTSAHIQTNGLTSKQQQQPQRNSQHLPSVIAHFSNVFYTACLLAGWMDTISEMLYVRTHAHEWVLARAHPRMCACGCEFFYRIRLAIMDFLSFNHTTASWWWFHSHRTHQVEANGLMV